MITRNTVLILGAGASAPYGFPVARGLVSKLANFQTTWQRQVGTSSNEVYDEAFLHPSLQDEQQVNAFRRDLIESQFDSIDSFLTARPEYAEIGKAAIAAALIPCEYPSRLNGVELLNGNWYRHLRNQMGNSFEDFVQSANHLSIVTFNYDRSLEYYFHGVISASYPGPLVVDTLQRIKIVHIYGQLGKPHFLSKNGRAFSTELNADSVAKCVEEIKVIPHDANGSPEFREAVKLIDEADVVCFLGFGYNETTLKALATKKPRSSGTVFGTTFGMKPAERAKAIGLVYGHLSVEAGYDGFGHENEDALEFLKTYSVL